MRKILSLVLVCAMLCSLFVGCSNDNPSVIEPTEQPNAPDTIETKPNEPITDNNAAKSNDVVIDGVQIALSDDKITVNGVDISTDNTQDVYLANDIVCYEDGHDFTYGEGEEHEAHAKEDADKHHVVHITKAGTYILSGKLSAGQIAIDLGEEAETDETAIVNLYLNGVDITCSVAPSVIFYNVYECGVKDEETASATVDTSKAGANVFIVDDSVNLINGSHVARIYKEGTVVLNEEGTEVEDAKKLHKYDAAFYSRMTMNMNGGEKGNGVLKIEADNEGLDSELHLTINGGVIDIESGNDCINTNEDNISVTTINGGEVNIYVNGKTGEGDGVDSNGWLVINGGIVRAQACAKSGDAGIDSDMGIHINGGTVFATGNMLDRISESSQTFAVFQFDGSQQSGTYALKNSDGRVVAEYDVDNAFMYMIVSDPNMVSGEYTLWCDNTQFVGTKTGNVGGGMRPDEDKRPDGTGNEDFDPNVIPPNGFGNPDGEEMTDVGEMIPPVIGSTNETHPMPSNDNKLVMPNNPGANVEIPSNNNLTNDEPAVPEVGHGSVNGGPHGYHGEGDRNDSELSDAFVIEGGKNYFVGVGAKN